ncbi:MAG: hypothetical protein M3082_08175 [Candidatus Dormibacteraeota bacterium]|nr:hypothetical protein [Candidatus Dormibacteraeota bacterium]
MDFAVDSFAGEAVVGRTRHFLITTSPDSPVEFLTSEKHAAALAIEAGCEADLATLSDWFAVNWDDFPYSIWVSVGRDDDPRPHAANHWQGTSQSPQIWVYGATLSNSTWSIAIRDELARMLFVAELAEVLMRFSPNGWNPANSAGEGLSRVAAAELHKLGYYRPSGSASNGPHSTGWLQLAYRTRNVQDADATGARYDFITVSDNTDLNSLSYGCAILFLYYLHAQLNYSWRRIATSWGAHLCETFAQLTGRPSHTAFTEFSDVLNPHLPPGTTQSPPTDNVFPLAANPPVVLVALLGTSTRTIQQGEHLATLQPGPMCGEGVYSYRIIDVVTPVSVVAQAFASFAPRFTWSVNGVSLPFHGTQQQVTIPVRVTETAPGHGQPAQDGVLLSFSYLITDFNGWSQLDIKNLGFPGNIDGLEFTAVMSEAGAIVPSGVRTGSTTANPIFRDYSFEIRWYEDVSRCNVHAVGVAAINRKALLGEIFVLKNTPDPSPEQLNRVVLAARAYARAAGEVTSGAPGSVSTLANVLNRATMALRAGDDGVELAGDGQIVRAAPILPPTQLNAEP